MNRQQRNTVGAYAIQTMGIRKGWAVLMFCATWWHMSDKIGRPFDAEEYGKWWVISRSQAFRRQAMFRECFPGYDTPDELRAVLNGVPKSDDIETVAAALLSVPLPVAA